MITRRNLILGNFVYHSVLIVILFSLGVHRQIYRKFRPADSPAAYSERYSFGVLYHSRMDETVPDHSVIFIGDSFTAGLCTDAVTTPSVNYGIGSDTTKGVMERLSRYKSLSRALAVVYQIGINDMSSLSNEEIETNVDKIIKITPKGPRIVICAIMPPAMDFKASTRTQQLNARLSSLANRHQCIFVDPSPKLSTSQGLLLHAYDDGDGVHLNASGNKVWIEYLQSALGTIR